MLKEKEAQEMEEAPSILLPPSQCLRLPPRLLPGQGWVLLQQETFWSPTLEGGRSCRCRQHTRHPAAVQGASLPGSVPKPEPGCQRRGRQRLIDHSHFLAVHQVSLPESSERFCLDVQLHRKKKFIHLEDPLKTMRQKSLQIFSANATAGSPVRSSLWAWLPRD